MIDKELTDHIVLVGPQYEPPRGGIAQVVNLYDELLFADMHYVTNSSKGKLRNAFICVGAIMKLAWMLCTSRRLKVVHIHTASKISFKRSVIFIRIAQWLGRKVIVHIHGGNFKVYYDESAKRKSWVQRVLQSADAVIVLAESWKRQFAADLQLDNLHVVPNIIQYPSERPVADDGKLHMLFMGLIRDAKGIFDMIDVFASLDRDMRSQVVFHVGGNGETERFVAEVNKHGLDDVIRFEGWLSGDRKNELLNQCEILIHPSYVDALPLTILEAMSYGMAILTTNVGGIPSIVKENQNGFMVEPGDKQGLTVRLAELIGDKSLRQRFGQQSKTMVDSYYAENVGNKLTVLYKELLND